MKPVWETTQADGGAGDPVDPVAENRAPLSFGGPVGIGLRFFCVAVALVSVTLAVLASTDRRLAPDDASRPLERLGAGLPATGDALTASVRSSDGPAAFLPSAMPRPAVDAAPAAVVAAEPRYPALSPGDICKVIDVSASPGGWVPSPVYPGEWECISTKTVESDASTLEAPDKAKGDKAKGDKAKGKAAKSGYKLFTMGRGTSEGDIRYVRFKISASDETQADRSAQNLALQLKSLFDALNWPVPEKAAISTRLRHAFTMDDQGTQIRFLEERLTPWNYNLIVTFPAAQPIPERVPAAAEIAMTDVPIPSKAPDERK